MFMAFLFLFEPRVENKRLIAITPCVLFPKGAQDAKTMTWEH